MPYFSWNWTGLGNPESWNPAFRNDQSYTFNANASWVKGTHEIRFGFDYIHHLMNHFQPELGYGPRGSFNFGAGPLALNPSALEETVGFLEGTPDFETDQAGLAAAMMGIPDSASKSSQYIKMDSLEGQYALYIRDRWRATPKLTFDCNCRTASFQRPRYTRSFQSGMMLFTGQPVWQNGTPQSMQRAPWLRSLSSGKFW